MPEPTTGAAVVTGHVIAKYFAVHAGAGALAAALGFLILWPRTMREGFARLFCTIVSSSLFGPMLVVHLHSTRPELFSSAQSIALLQGLDEAYGLLIVATPLLVVAGLPAWWLIGAAVRLVSRNSDSWLTAFVNWLKRKLE